MKFQQLIVAVIVAMTVDSTDGQAAATAPVRKRTHLRHMSSETRSEEQKEIYDPFIGISRELDSVQSMSIPKVTTAAVSSMSLGQNRHLSSKEARSKEQDQDEVYDPFVGISRELGVGVRSSMSTKLTAAPVISSMSMRANRSHLRRAEEHDEVYDPFIGITRELEEERSMSMPSSMSMTQSAVSESEQSNVSCPLECGNGQVCAFSSPGSEPFCYPKCSPSFPTFTDGSGECRAEDICVHSTFTCGSYNDVMNHFCECNTFDSETTGTYLCWLSQCEYEVSSDMLV